MWFGARSLDCVGSGVGVVVTAYERRYADQDFHPNSRVGHDSKNVAVPGKNSLVAEIGDYADRKFE